MTTRLKQVVIVAAGAAVALVMVFLGLWQAQVFVDKGNRSVADRAAQAPVALTDHLGPDNEVGDIYGKRVHVRGRYLPGQVITVPTGDGVRVLAALELADGRVLPVVRGLAADETAIPAPPVGAVTETGLFLPGEGDSDAGVRPDQLASVRMPLVAQRWPQQLVAGFVTLSPDSPGAQGLAEAPVDLPEGQGSAQNAGYALQWWVFAAFGFGMTLKIAHSLGVRERRAREDAARLALRGRDAAPAAPGGPDAAPAASATTNERTTA